MESALALRNELALDALAMNKHRAGAGRGARYACEQYYEEEDHLLGEASHGFGVPPIGRGCRR
jgi:hypothetical protein